ncbi:MAG: HEAT repeat domain-containing protein [Methylococcaceae bacterium]|nr:HEAT repeat domain-containing protein [Methylococcaceae bacterium]MDZ4155089.1 HEAT repeat domain-containing protein [Methylococcales bacterium]MDP2394466.1 HEAT repeat domain-containing protein [Methylococcaceae bacterium]MDP3021509.1 HEAT repeat domain-containing protein [Methylococcaceae bacterium]MDP3390372.1 HEAT repeat domain-containing protein [Methylococcaceae bacterium]
MAWNQDTAHYRLVANQDKLYPYFAKQCLCWGWPSEFRRTIFSLLMNTPRTLALLACLALYTASGFAAAEDVSNNSPVSPPSSIQLTLSKQAPDAIRLEARQAPLGKILKAIADKTGVNIHYSVLPDAPVTATCIGENVGQIMDCLLAKQIGLVTHKAQKDKPAEFWLLGSSVGSCQAVTIEPTAPPAEQSVIEAGDNSPPQASKEQTDAVLAELKNAKTVAQRNEALSHITMGADINDPGIRKAMDDALSDQNAGIRVQALATLSVMDKDNAAQALNRALQDKDSSVRTAAIENAADNRELLERALTDRDASVSSFAAAKLAALKRKEERQAQQ